MIVVGAGVIFLAIQPAGPRKPQCADTPHRLLDELRPDRVTLLVAFVVANVLFSLKVPNKLDTTATGFYSLSENTRNLLARLNEPITAYAVRLEGPDRMSNDIRQLLLACQDASNGKFKVKFVSDVANKDELNSLAHKYPKLEMALSERSPFGDDEDSGAILLTVG